MTGFGAYNADAIISDLSAFADLGTSTPSLDLTKAGPVIRFVRSGEATSLTAEGTLLIETFEGKSIKHSDFRAMLASDRYGALREWATNQNAFFQKDFAGKSFLEQSGVVDNRANKFSLDSFDELLIAPQKSDSARLVLIDGPAGIGKTQFIERLAASRAKNYQTQRRPLILHVQSRGRTLSFIYDLMAYSLQRLRISVTFDQIPTLARHGLVTVAIDGFDELADPDGYDFAWSQVSEFVALLRGHGSLILAGRETFIGKERVLKDIKSLRSNIDDISVLTLQPPTKAEALEWLSAVGWSNAELDLVSDYLEPSSLALRPFFLKTLSDASIAGQLANTSSESILAILTEAMVLREVAKFGDAVESELSAHERRQFVTTLMSEAARDMAENATASISDGSLAWLVEVALPKPVSDSTLRLLKGRAQVIAFLTNDDRPGYRRFYHEKFSEYFLSLVLVDTITRAELSKPLSRGLLGSSFLETFGDIVASAAGENAKTFIVNLQRLANESPPIDRTSRNAGALCIASLSLAEKVSEFRLQGVGLDEVRFSGVAASAVVRDVVISQFDCRAGDLSKVAFEKCSVFTLIGDDETLLPEGFPEPTRVQDTSRGGQAYTDPVRVNEWLCAHLEAPPAKPAGLVPPEISEHPAIRLLQKACRLRNYWVRRGDDVFASRILENEWWQLVEQTLSENNLLKMEFRPAAGSDARFVHIRRSEDILLENTLVDEVRNFYGDIVGKILSLNSN